MPDNRILQATILIDECITKSSNSKGKYPTTFFKKVPNGNIVPIVR